MVKWRVVVNHQIPRFISKRHRFVVMELFTIGMENNAATVNIFYHIELNCYLFKQKRILKCPSYGNKQFIYINIVLSWNGKLYHHNKAKTFITFTGELYDPEKSMCCNDTVHDKENRVCCGSKLFTSDTHPVVCCGGKLHNSYQSKG